MEINKELLLKFIGAVSLLQGQAEDVINAYDNEEYAINENLEFDLKEVKERIDTVNKIQKEIYIKCFK